VDETVVALGHHAGPAADDLDAVATGPEMRCHALARQEMREGGDARRGREVAREAVPVVAVDLAQERHEPLLGVIGRGLLQIEGEERAVPPAHLVVGEVADAEGAALVGCHQAAGSGAHALLGRGVEGIDPVEARRAAELQVGDDGEGEDIGRQRRGARGVEAPRRGTGTRDRQPGVEARVEGSPVIRDATRGFARRPAAIECVDPDREERIAAGRDEPGDALAGFEAPARAGRGRQGRARGSRAGGRRRRGQGGRIGARAKSSYTVRPPVTTSSPGRGQPSEPPRPGPSLDEEAALGEECARPK